MTACEALSIAMAEFGIISSAAGIISLGITVCKGLLDYYSAFQDADTSVKQTHESIDAVAVTLVLIPIKLRENRKSLDANAVSHVTSCVHSCATGIQALNKKLKKLPVGQTGDGWIAKAEIVTRKALYPFKESTLVKLKEICNELKGNLLLALNVLHM